MYLHPSRYAGHVLPCTSLAGTRNFLGVGLHCSCFSSSSIRTLSLDDRRAQQSLTVRLQCETHTAVPATSGDHTSVKLRSTQPGSSLLCLNACCKIPIMQWAGLCLALKTLPPPWATWRTIYKTPSQVPPSRYLPHLQLYLSQLPRKPVLRTLLVSFFLVRHELFNIFGHSFPILFYSQNI